MKFSKGNKKIGKDTIIFNMGPASKCPSDALGYCELSDVCYAKKAEKQYHHCVPQYREEQMECWNKETDVDIASQIIDKVLRARKNKIKYVRFNESGDFWDQDSLDKLIRICHLLRQHEDSKHIIVYGYTNRWDLDYEHLPDNLIINGTNMMISNEFIPIEGELITDKMNACNGDCRCCDKCKEATHAKIYVALH